MSTPSPLPTSDDIKALLETFTVQSGRLRELAEQHRTDELAAVVEELSANLLVADEELRVQNEQLEQSSRNLDLLVLAHEQLFANAPAAYVQTDEDGIIVRLNAAAQRLLRLPTPMRRSRPLTNLVRSADRPALRTLITRLRAGEGEGELIEATIERSDGSTLPLVFTARPSGTGGGAQVLHWELRERSRGAADALSLQTESAPTDAPALLALASAAADLAAQDGVTATADRLVRQCRAAVLGCDDADVVIVRSRGRVDQPCSTPGAAREATHAQRSLGIGPWLDAVDDSAPVYTGDVLQDTRWPGLADELRAQRMQSVLAIPLTGRRGKLGALVLYSREPNAIVGSAQVVAQALATHGAIALEHAEIETNLRVALRTREEIARAVGILMERHKMSPDAAFDELVRVSQRAHVKLHDVAAWVQHTGEDPATLVQAARRNQEPTAR